MAQTMIDTREELAQARELYAAGDYDQALMELQECVANAPDGETRLGALLLRACIQSERFQYSTSLQTLGTAAPLVDDAPAKLKARFHGQRAHLRVKLGKLDRALVDYEAARVWAHEAGDDLSVAIIYNNLAKVYSGLGSYSEAIDNSDIAIRMFLRAGDRVNLGRAYDQRAQIHIEHREFADALNWSRKAINNLGSHPLLTEARTTHGRALIGLASNYLEDATQVDRYRSYRMAVDSLEVALDADLVRSALERTDGNTKQAASLLNLPRTSLIDAVNRFHLDSHQRRHHRKSLITK